MARTRAASPQTVGVLQQLAQNAQDWQYGYDLSRSTGLKSGTLYPILIRLAEWGWLETRWAEPECIGRPARHLYRLTTDGMAAAATLTATAEARGTAQRRPRPALS
ncbi:PadR family transcriptional regulator [Amycolatopsis balhimycina DSM 5908]|uniref:PadR family transcriptional regulator n=1 Tax=Amycolatopsis balhimycina DSM 5908 TaxID=1081091 RepID=A0A428VWV2_AMYBA|nr:PadR family transcriptional regulator [Amycolatopsis balhimycina]RSM35277.1 PadR family transcriptional regulator [Amycolatopsis balhimycina DSM 5908]